MMNRYKELYPAALLLAGGISRFWNLTNSPAWYDESFTMLITRVPINGMVEAILWDVHPPFYYLLVRIATGLLSWVPTLAVIRGLSAALGIIGLLLFWYLSGLLGLPRAGRVAGLAVMTFSPMQVYYSQEGRMYTLLQALVLLQAICIYKRKYPALGAFSLLAMYTHYYGLLYTAVLGLAALGMEAKRVGWVGLKSSSPAKALAASLLAAGVGWLPWAWVLYQQMGSIARGGYWIQPLTIGGVIGDIFSISVGWIIPPRFLIPSILALAAGLFLLIYWGAKQKRFTLLLWLVGPVSIAVIVSLLWKPMLLFRGLFPSWSAAALLIGFVWPGSKTIGKWLLLIPWLAVLGWGIGANQQGYKSQTQWPKTSPGPIVVHLETTSLIYGMANWGESKNYLLLANCQRMDGELTDKTRHGLGVEYVTMDQLPALGGFHFAGLVSVLSTKCHEDTYNQLAVMGQVETEHKLPLLKYGVFDESNSQFIQPGY